MNEPTKEQWKQFDKHHIRESLDKKPKWLKTMSKEEIRNGYEEVQRELNGEKK